MKKIFLLLFCFCLIFNTGCNFGEMQAKMGDSEAKYKYAMKCKDNGDMDNYKFWLYESSDKGNKKAQLELAKYLTDKVIDGDENSKETILDQKDIDLITKVADEGNSEIQYALGVMYSENKGISKNDENSKIGDQYIQKAIESGNDKASLYLAKKFIHFSDVMGKFKTEGNLTQSITNYESAITYCLTKPASKGNSEAQKILEETKEKLANLQFDLALIYHQNENDKEAFNLISKVAESNFEISTQAQYNLGVCYLYGEGCEQDIEKAKYYFEKAAKNGLTDAIEALEKI